MLKPKHRIVSFSSESFIKGSALLCLALLVIHCVLTIVHYRLLELPWLLRELFDVDEEESIPTWFSSSMLLITSLNLFLIAHVARLEKERDAPYWWGLGAGFLFMSVDEIAGFHETLNSVTEFSWALPGLIVAAIIGGAYLGFLTRLPGAFAVKFMVAGSVFVGGAVGVELATEPYLYNDALDTLAYNLWTPVEEGMEMGSVIFFLSTLFDYLRRFYQVDMRLALDKKD